MAISFPDTRDEAEAWLRAGGFAPMPTPRLRGMEDSATATYWWNPESAAVGMVLAPVAWRLDGRWQAGTHLPSDPVCRHVALQLEDARAPERRRRSGGADAMRPLDTSGSQASVPVTWAGGAPAAGPKPAVVRWLGLFRGRGEDFRAAAAWEALAERERAAEPLWRGKAASCGLLGLGYAAGAVRVARAADCWSEPAEDGRLTLACSRPRRAWRDWDAFARQWAGRQWRPDYHAEAWLRRGAQPTCVVLSRALQIGRVWDAGRNVWRDVAPDLAASLEGAGREIAAMLNLPTVWVGNVMEDRAML